MRVLISGASIAGPVLAYWLNRYGFEVTLVERASALRKSGGHAVDLFRPAMAVVGKMGLRHAIRDKKTGADAIVIHRDNSKPVTLDLRKVYTAVSDDQWRSCATTSAKSSTTQRVTTSSTSSPTRSPRYPTTATSPSNALPAPLRRRRRRRRPALKRPDADLRPGVGLFDVDRWLPVGDLGAPAPCRQRRHADDRQGRADRRCLRRGPDRRRTCHLPVPHPAGVELPLPRRARPEAIAAGAFRGHGLGSTAAAGRAGPHRSLLLRLDHAAAP